MTDEELEQVLSAHWDRVCREERLHGLGGLSASDRSFFVVRMLEAEVENGGFCQYLFNSTGDLALEAVAALREVGAERLARVCERFFALLPGGGPAATQPARQSQLEQAVATLGEVAFAEATEALEAEFYAGEDELRRQVLEHLRRAQH